MGCSTTLRSRSSALWDGKSHRPGAGPPRLSVTSRRLKPAELASFIAMMCCVHEVVPGIPDYLHGEKRNMAGFDKRHKIGLEKVRDQVTREMKAKFAEIDRRRAAKEKKPKLQTSAKGQKKKKGAAA